MLNKCTHHRGFVQVSYSACTPLPYNKHEGSMGSARCEGGLCRVSSGREYKDQSWHGQHQAGVWPVKVTISCFHALIDSSLKPSPSGLLHRCRVTHAKLVKTPGAKSAGEGQICHHPLKTNTHLLAFWPFEAPHRQGY